MEGASPVSCCTAETNSRLAPASSPAPKACPASRSQTMTAPIEEHRNTFAPRLIISLPLFLAYSRPTYRGDAHRLRPRHYAPGVAPLSESVLPCEVPGLPGPADSAGDGTYFH